MSDARAFVEGRFRSADVHPAVDLHRVDRDDLGARALRDREGETALAGRGRADQEAAGKTFEKASSGAGASFHDRASLAAPAERP
jgi:hypothetical protein